MANRDKEKLFVTGSLVDFNGGPFPWASRRYVCPGIIIEDEICKPSERQTVTVMWADGRITKEWPVYLTHAECEDIYDAEETS